MKHEVTIDFGGHPLTIETGRLAKQAHGSVLVSYGDTRILATAVSSKEPKEGIDFFPLTVEFSEKFYAAGKIPGSFFKREGRPTADATLSARMIDRPMRPLFPEGYRNETQIVISVLSLDSELDLDAPAAVAASAAVHISDIPFNGPVAACRITKINGEIRINAGWEVINDPENQTDLEVLISGTKNAIMMVEGGAKEIPEAELLEAILKGHEEIKKIVGAIEELREKAGVPKREFTLEPQDESVVEKVSSLAREGLEQALKTKDKKERGSLVKETKKNVIEALVPASLHETEPKEAAKKQKQAETAFDDLQYEMMRSMILKDRARIDGRDHQTIRPISTEVGILPRAHGSSLFTRGETQILSTVTLGTSEDEQIIDSLFENTKRKFLFHYNFPPFSVGECGRLGGQSRREIGHGALAQRALERLLPHFDEFPYTIRVVCETLESNGSSSMGSVCAGSMALMAAGVPFPKPVAGIAMGLIKEGDSVEILSDILGDEDHLGDIDFKVAGTRDGVTAIQMDIKIEGVSREIMEKALEQAKQGRLHILGKMEESIKESRADLSQHAPRIESIQVAKDKIASIIGPGGKNIKNIIATSGAKVDIDDTGLVKIASTDGEAMKIARDMVIALSTDPEEGVTYKGTVKRVVDFGAFVEILPGQEGLLHISEIAYERVNQVEDYIKEGDQVEVKCIEVDPTGRIRLSRRALMDPPEGWTPPASGGGRGGGGGGGRRPHRNDRGGGGHRGGGNRSRSGGGGGGSHRGTNPNR